MSTWSPTVPPTPTILAQADQTNGSGWFNGDDAVVLRKGTTDIDVIGQIGFDPGTEWGSGLTSTADNTLRRNSTICAGDPNGADAFDPALEWEGFATNTFDGLGAHTATCGGADAAPDRRRTPSRRRRNRYADQRHPERDLQRAGQRGRPVVHAELHGLRRRAPRPISGGPTVFSIDPTSDFIDGESCTLTILAASVTDQDADDPPDNMALDFIVGFTHG